VTPPTLASALTGAPSFATGEAQCLHCRRPTAPADRFCCAGCDAAYQVISGLGLSTYYARRDAAEPAARPEPDATRYALFAREDGSGWALDAMVDGIDCAACAWLIEEALKRSRGVEAARVSLTMRRLMLRWSGAREDAERLGRIVTGLGFRLAPYDPAKVGSAADHEDRRLLLAMGVAGFAMANVMLLSVAIWSGGADMGEATRDLLHWASALIALPAIAYAIRPFYASAWAALRAGRSNMDVPISIGVTLAAAMSLYEITRSGEHAYFDSAVALLFFLLIGRFLDRRARGRARNAIENLVSGLGASATVIEPSGRQASVPLEALREGMIVLVAPGDKIGVDGVVLEGRSDIDAALLSGESLPRAVGPGAEVHAGTINLLAPLRIRAKAVGEGTVLAEIRRLVAIAEAGRTRLVVLADRVARAYAPVVHVLAAATFVGWLAFADVAWQTALLHAVAVLIITCPCALGLAVPVVQVVASGRLLREGLLFKSATALERLAQVDTVVLDKTGTLTRGRPTLRPDPTRDAVALHLAAAIAASSRHPLARAIVDAAPDVPAASGVVEHPGFGLAQGEIRLGSRTFCGLPPGEDAESEAWLTRPGLEPVRFVFGDRLRKDAAEAIAAFNRLGLAVEILSGDRRAVVADIAAEVGIERYQAEADPRAKTARLAALAAEGRKVLMIGDGLNDAPALASAHISIAPGNGADVATLSADAVLARDALKPAAEAIRIARFADRLVRQNLALAVLYNALAVPLAVLGLVTPIIAAAAMSSSSILVIANALRLNFAGGTRP